MKCSRLNHHLFLLHVIDSAECICGFHIENNKHYLFECPLYSNIRNNMLKNIKEITGYIDEELLLFGSTNFTYNENKSIFNSVKVFIEESNRL